MSQITERLSGLGKEFFWYGRHNENEKQVRLSAGSLSAIYENGNLRYISAGENELLRMIYPAVRDRTWLTVAPSSVNENIHQDVTSFSITTVNIYRNDEIDFSAKYIIEGRNDNSISFIMEGHVLGRTVKNRIGICVLHSASVCSGSNCIIEHTDGTIEESFFPDKISPYQIFRNLKSIKWLTKGIHCSVSFEGDIFETEDQRNWSDATYKTYSTPLSIPYPQVLDKGTRIYQKVVFRAERIPEIRDPVSGAVIISIFPDKQYRLPSIGISRSSRYTHLSRSDIKALRTVSFDHYRADLHLFTDGWKEYASRAVNESSDLGYPLELALFTDDDATKQVRHFIDWCREKRPNISSVLLLHKSQPSTPDQIASVIIPVLKEQFPHIRTATGTNAGFAEINRFRPGNTGNDNVCYSIHPQEHASDNLTLTENLAPQAYTVESAFEFAKGKGIIISPVTLRRRFNANVSFYELPGTGKVFPFNADSRLMSLFGAGWTTGSIKYLCESGADSITYYETAGERGIIQGEDDSMFPDLFPSVRGMVFPVYYIFRYLLGSKQFIPVRTVSSNPLKVECLAMTDGRQGRVIMANLTSSVQKVSLDCCSGLFRKRTLDASCYIQAASDPKWKGSENEETVKSQTVFQIEPYSINFIEGWVKH